MNPQDDAMISNHNGHLDLRRTIEGTKISTTISTLTTQQSYNKGTTISTLTTQQSYNKGTTISTLTTQQRYNS